MTNYDQLRTPVSHRCPTLSNIVPTLANIVPTLANILHLPPNCGTLVTFQQQWSSWEYISLISLYKNEMDKATPELVQLGHNMTNYA